MGGSGNGGFNQWLTEHPIITYVIIAASLIYIFNAVFRPRKLPLLKDALVYILILLGAFLLLFFQTRVGLPIVHGFIVAIVLMVTVRIRSWLTKRNQPTADDPSASGSEDAGQTSRSTEEAGR